LTKKSIAFILPDLHGGGAEKITTLLANELSKKAEFDVFLILMRKEGYFLDELSVNVTIIDLKINRIRQSIFKILKTIYTHKFDVVFCGYGEVNAFLSPFIPFFKNTKFIARETNVVSEHVKRKEILFFYRFYNNFHRIIAQSNDMKFDLIENIRIKKEKIVKINNPIDFDLIETKLENKPIPTEFRNNSTKKIVAIGNLSHRKGFDNLLQVFSFLKNEPFELFIIGDGPQKEEFCLLKEKLQLKTVYFLGPKENPYPYLKFADLFVLSSRYEGFPNVLLEAGACGTYSLSNNCKGGINEIIMEKINGEVFCIENHQEFAEKIKELVMVEKNKTAIIKSIKNRYSKEIILNSYFKLFDFWLHPQK
jgi:glycosyltransferase involved in cell wall biosynthesis